jgi:GT2 family glycosyltransferase
MGNSMKIGVVTVTYNSGRVIEDFMTSVLFQKYTNFILYVMDNASSDDTLEKLSKYNDQRIVIVKNKENLGVATGNNQGINASIRDNCEYILLINNDTEFDSQLIETMLEGLDEYSCDMVVPKIMYHDNPKIIWSAGGYFRPWAACLCAHYGMGAVDYGQHENVRRVEYAPTCCTLIKKSVFDTIGLMDEKYFVYYDDSEFCFRAMKSGISMFYLPTAVLLHKVSSLTGGQKSTAERSDFTVHHLTRGLVYSIKKHQGIASAPFIASYGAFLFFKFLTGKESLKVFRVKQKAFLEALSL